MKCFPALISLPLLAGLIPLSVSASTRICCVGNSITQGNYPDDLQGLLGDDYTVIDRGIHSTTMLRNGNAPYWESSEFSLVFDDEPDIITIMLGTNDSKAYNWDAFQGEFADDCRALLDTFATIRTRPLLYLCLPPPAFPPETHSISAYNLEHGVVPLLRQVAEQREVPLIDVHTPLKDSVEYFPDHVHPNHDGEKAIARIMYEVLVGDTDHVAVVRPVKHVPSRVQTGGSAPGSFPIWQVNGRVLVSGNGTNFVPGWVVQEPGAMPARKLFIK